MHGLYKTSETLRVFETQMLNRHTGAAVRESSLNGLVSLPEVFFEPYYMLHNFETMFCPSCKTRNFHEMNGPMPLMHTPAPTKWYWCSNCYLQVRRSELNDAIDKYLGETKTIHIDMTKTKTSASSLLTWLRRLQGWWWS